MAERSILSYFNSRQEAESAIPKLQALRANGVSVDRIGEFPGSGVTETINPLTGDVPSLGYLTLDANVTSRDEGILLAANTDASGLSDGGDHAYTSGPGNDARRDTLLTATVDESVYEQAMRVIREAGGTG